MQFVSTSKNNERGGCSLEEKKFYINVLEVKTVKLVIISFTLIE